MQIQSQTQSTDLTQLTDTASTAPKPSANAKIDGLANENTFLQLLVAQIKNQDPLQPADGIQFLSQLAQFSQLEQLIGIRQELQPSTTPSTPPASSKSGTGQDGATGGVIGTTN